MDDVMLTHNTQDMMKEGQRLLIFGLRARQNNHSGAGAGAVQLTTIRATRYNRVCIMLELSSTAVEVHVWHTDRFRCVKVRGQYPFLRVPLAMGPCNQVLSRLYTPRSCTRIPSLYALANGEEVDLVGWVVRVGDLQLVESYGKQQRM